MKPQFTITDKVEKSYSSLMLLNDLREMLEVAQENDLPGDAIVYVDGGNTVGSMSIEKTWTP